MWAPPCRPRNWTSKTWGATLWNGLSRNEQFRDSFVSLSADQLNTIFTPENVISTLDSLAAGIAPEMQRQTDRWDNVDSVAAWQANIEQIRQFARDRPAYHRQHIVRYFGLGGTAILTVERTGSGSVQIGTITPSSYPWSGQEFQDVPVTLVAAPATGETFLGWEGAASGTSPEIKIVLSKDETVRAVFTPGNLSGPAAPIWVSRKSPATVVNLTKGASATLLVELANPSSAPYEAQWTLDGVPVQSGGLSYAFNAGSLGAHRVVLTLASGATTIAQAWNITVAQGISQQCYNSVQELPASCTGASTGPWPRWRRAASARATATSTGSPARPRSAAPAAAPACRLTSPTSARRTACAGVTARARSSSAGATSAASSARTGRRARRAPATRSDRASWRR
jgi:hypothetical protein